MRVNPKIEKARNEIKQEIRLLLVEGKLSYQDIAWKVGRSQSYVYQLAVKEGLRRSDLKAKQEVPTSLPPDIDEVY